MIIFDDYDDHNGVIVAKKLHALSQCQSASESHVEQMLVKKAMNYMTISIKSRLFILLATYTVHYLFLFVYLSG